MPHVLCQGRSDIEPCIFSGDGRGNQRSLNSAALREGRVKCMFCDPEVMAQVCHDKNYCVALRDMKKFPEVILMSAMQSIPLEQRDFFKNKLKQTRLCIGWNGEICRYALSKAGGKARARSGHDTCLFCDADAFGEMLGDEDDLQILRSSIQKMQDAAARHVILTRTPQEYRMRLMDLLPEDVQ
eukprot:242910-Karenia_brevis.AAC.1